MPNRFLILGPAGQDHLPMFWSQSMGEWVERDDATLYTGNEVFSFPARELPSGVQGIIDIETGEIHTPRPWGV
jgi:hypothetical protein